MEIVFLGPLSELSDNTIISPDGIATTDQLKEKLKAIYPVLSGIPYALAVNNHIVHGNIQLHSDDTVALLPPYSGG